MKREMNNYTWIAMTVMLLWSVALFATNAPKGNNQSDNRPFSYTLVQGQTAPNVMPFRSTSSCPSVVGNSNIFYREGATTPVGSPTPYYTPFRSRKGDMDDEVDPAGEEVGYIDTPVGEPFVLLLMAGAYFLFATLRKRQKEYHHLLNKNALKFAYMQKKLYLCSRV